MVFARDRRAKQGEDSVPCRLHDIAFVAADRLDHEIEGRVDDRAGFFGVEILGKSCRADDVNEERGN